MHRWFQYLNFQGLRCCGDDDELMVMAPRKDLAIKFMRKILRA